MRINQTVSFLCPAKIKAACLALLFFALTINGFTQESAPQPGNREPAKALLVTSDIDNFWRAYDLAAKEAAPEKKREIFQREYFDKGSKGLEDFTKARIHSADALLAEIARRPLFYASIRQQTLKVSAMSGNIQTSFRNLKKLYADAVFPDVYFTIGRLTSGGTTSKNGLLIGTEMYGRSKATPTAELNNWLKEVLKPIDALPAIVAHEIIHFQQKSTMSPKLLARSIDEGAADFIGEMIAGQTINPHLHTYGNPRERQLWEEFRQEMQAANYTKWLYNGGSAKDRPADLGYYMGYKICESYYKNAKDKRLAIKEILAIKDFDKFLQDSRYAEKFAGQ
jgi:uncharacterized protein YjaZ